jgi:hypothetical protein
VDKTAAFPNLYHWFMKLVAKKDLPLDVLSQAILTAGREALSAAPVYITNYYAKIRKGQTGICPSRGEAYTLRQGALCFSCQGEGYYRPVENPADIILRRAVSQYQPRSMKIKVRQWLNCMILIINN